MSNEAASALLIDAGNTRIKWAFLHLDSQRLEPTQAANYQDATWALQLERQMAANACNFVLLASVAGKDVAERISDLCQARAISLHTLRNGFTALGLKQTVYADPNQLGVDRCVLMIAARETEPADNLCVVSCGTALTVDFLDTDGRHLGGIISASPQAIQEKIRQDAAAIRIDWESLGQNSVTPFAGSTEQAIYSGSMLGAASLVSQMWQQLVEEARLVGQGEQKRQWKLLYSGGGLPALLPLLPKIGVYYPDLLMSGLAAIAQSQYLAGTR